MVMSRVKINLESYCFYLGKRYWWVGLDGDDEKRLDMGWILEEELKKDYRRLDVVYEEKRGVKDDFWVWSLNSWVGGDVVIWDGEDGGRFFLLLLI